MPRSQIAWSGHPAQEVGPDSEACGLGRKGGGGGNQEKARGCKIGVGCPLPGASPRETQRAGLMNMNDHHIITKRKEVGRSKGPHPNGTHV